MVVFNPSTEAGNACGNSETLSYVILEVSGLLGSCRFGVKEVDKSLQNICGLLTSISTSCYHIRDLVTNHGLDPDYPPLQQRPASDQLPLLNAINLELMACRDTVDTLQDKKIPEMRAKAPNLLAQISGILQPEAWYRKHSAEIATTAQLARLVEGHCTALRMLLLALKVQIALTRPHPNEPTFSPRRCVDQMREGVESLRRVQEAPKIAEIPEFKADFAYLLQWADWFMTLATTELLNRGEEEAAEPSLHANAPPPLESSLPSSSTETATGPPATQLASTDEEVDLDVEIIRKLESRADGLAKIGKWAEALEARTVAVRKMAELSPEGKGGFNLNQEKSKLAFETLYAGNVVGAAKLFSSLNEALTSQHQDDLSEVDKDVLFNSHQGLAEVYIKQEDYSEAAEYGRAAAFGRRARYGKTDSRTYESLYTLAAALELKGEKAEATVLREMIPIQIQGALRTEIRYIQSKAPRSAPNNSRTPLRDAIIAGIKARASTNEAHATSQAFMYEQHENGGYRPLSGIRALSKAVNTGTDVDVFNVINGFTVTGTGPRLHAYHPSYLCSTDSKGDWEMKYLPPLITFRDIDASDVLRRVLYDKCDVGMMAVILDKLMDTLSHRSRNEILAYDRRGKLYDIIREAQASRYKI